MPKILVPIFFAGCSFVLGACTPIPVGVTFSGAELEEKFAGNSMRLTRQKDGRVIVTTYYANGTGFGQFGPVRRDMEWEVRGNSLCMADLGKLAVTEDCATVTWTDAKTATFRSLRKSGEVRIVFGEIL